MDALGTAAGEWAAVALRVWEDIWAVVKPWGWQGLAGLAIFSLAAMWIRRGK